MYSARVATLVISNRLIFHVTYLLTYQCVCVDKTLVGSTNLWCGDAGDCTVRRQRNARRGGRLVPGATTTRQRCGNDRRAGNWHRRVPVEGQQLAPERPTKMRRHTQRPVDDGDVECEDDNERNRRVASELDVVESHVHEPVVW